MLFVVGTVALARVDDETGVAADVGISADARAEARHVAGFGVSVCCGADVSASIGARVGVGPGVGLVLELVLLLMLVLVLVVVLVLVLALVLVWMFVLVLGWC